MSQPARLFELKWRQRESCKGPVITADYCYQRVQHVQTKALQDLHCVLHERPGLTRRQAANMFGVLAGLHTAGP
eukprot:2575555-Amphidinium_carterae.3